MAGKFDPQLFFQQADNVALHVAASELFSLLSRSLDLPPKWAALVTRDTGDRAIVAAGGRVDGRGVEDVMFARVTPVDVVVEEEQVATRDGFNCKVEAHVRLSLIAERGELSSFQKAVLGSRRVVQATGLAQYLQPAIRTALGKLAAEHDAASLVGAGTSEAVSAALAEAVNSPCFSAGLVLDRDPTAKFESGSFGKVQQAQERAATRRAEHEAARQVQDAISRARAEHLDDLALLLCRLNSLASDLPEVGLPELLRTFSEHQRGELYQALFASESPAARTRWIVAAAGNELLFFDVKDSSQPSRRLTIEGEAGPVRSIQAVSAGDGNCVLLLGAATGVYRLPVDLAESDLTLTVGGALSVRGGFNAVELVGNRVFASHSELGLCEWNVDEPAVAERRFESMTRGAQTVRNVGFLGGDLYCSIDDRVIRFSADAPGDRPKQVYTGSGSIITSVCPTADELYAGNSDGDVLHWPVGRDADPEVLHRGMKRAAESLRVLFSHGLKRLVFTDTSLQVHARVLGDNFTCQYEAGGQTLRRVEVAPDMLVATNDLRDRLICWDSGKPKQPSAVIGVSSICGRSVQDVCLVAMG